MRSILRSPYFGKLPYISTLRPRYVQLNGLNRLHPRSFGGFSNDIHNKLCFRIWNCANTARYSIG